MFRFEKISLERIVTLFEILNTSSLLNREMIEKRFLRRAIDFDDTVAFLEELGLVVREGDHIILAGTYKNLRDCGLTYKDAVRSLIVECLLRNSFSLSDHLGEFLSHFVLVDDKYCFAPLAPQRIYYSSLRNFLIELGLIALDYSDTKYIVTDEQRYAFEKFIKRQTLSDAEFAEMQLRNKEIGDAAELQIVEYEKKRLSNCPHLYRRIEHTSKSDVRAGYDIKSYEECSESNTATPRYIEVKAVPVFNLRFFWSRNEIEKSELYRQLYYLYLLPVRSTGEFALENLLIINDPFVSVFNNKANWSRSFESLAFSLLSEKTDKPKKNSKRTGPFESYLVD